MTPSNQVSPHHFYLICGEVAFRSQDKEEEAGIFRLNAMLFLNKKRIPVWGLARAQQALQAQFFKQMNDPSLVVTNVTIVSLTYLGLMTEAEFNESAPNGFIQAANLTPTPKSELN